MVSTISTQQNFNTLQSLLGDQRKCFKQYVTYIKNALEVNGEVILYVREHCGEDFDLLLSEMERDGKIFVSRLEHLRVKLEICATYFSDTQKYYIKDGIKGRDIMYEKCLVNFFRFYDEKREMHNQFKQCQRKWLKVQDQILSASK